MEIPDLAHVIPSLLKGHPAVHGVSLVGSRARGDQGPLSDWDFRVNCDEPETLFRELSKLLQTLKPLAIVPDPLSRHIVVAAILPDATKVDFLFQAEHEPEPVWTVTRATLLAIDAHFWDWTLWLAGKQLKGENELVGAQLMMLAEYLLRPLGVTKAPRTLEEAASMFKNARDQWCRELRLEIPPQLGQAVEIALWEHGLVPA